MTLKCLDIVEKTFYVRTFLRPRALASAKGPEDGEQPKPMTEFRGADRPLGSRRREGVLTLPAGIFSRFCKT